MNELKERLDASLADVQWTDELKRRTRARVGEGQIIMKKKLSAGFVLAMAIVLLATAAYAVSTILRSPEANAVTLARRAVMEKYGLSSAAMGLFRADATEENGDWTVVLSENQGLPGKLIGEYTAIVKGEDATATWSYDDVDKALYESGDFSAPVWGAKQIDNYFKNHDAASPYIMAAGYDVRPAQTPAVLQPGEHHWRDEIVKDATPGEKDLTEDQAFEYAKAALIDEFGMTEKDFEHYDFMDDPDFYERADGSKIWLFYINVFHEGVECGCGVCVDAATGEIVFSQIITGGNG